MFDSNPGEGFNLRRDVFIRAAVMMRAMRSAHPALNFTLVLPPWLNLYHWRTDPNASRESFSWSAFFDVPSLSAYTPVIDLVDLIRMEPDIVVDSAITLQSVNGRGGWSEAFGERAAIRPCHRAPRFIPDSAGPLPYVDSARRFLGVGAHEVLCVTVQGKASVLESILVGEEKK